MIFKGELMSKVLKISVIIPTFKSQEMISNCLRALGQQTIKRDTYEIIVVDDESTDNTPNIVNTFPDVHLIVISHGGPSVARNIGVKAASGELIVFTDSDCIPASNWLEEITAPFKDSQIIGVKGVYRTNQDSLVSHFVQQEYGYKYKRMASKRYIDFIDTSAAAYRREIFLLNGGFDTSFTVPSVEDQELSFRLAQKGYRMVIAPNAAVYHFHDRNLLEYWIRKYRIGYWKAFMLRWLPQKTFSDSHTPPSQRLQIGLLGLAIICLLVGCIVPWFFWIFAGLIGLFFGVDLSFWIYVVKNDPPVGIIYPGLVLIRAAALGTGLFVGFLAPPQKSQHIQTSLSLDVFLIKRIFDIIGAIVGLILFAPIILIGAIAIVLDTPGSAFFFQTRAGENGKPFRMIKLRTMMDGAENHLNDVLQMNSLKGPVYKIQNDPRVTRVGRWLRRWSIDEIPQFWNVLKGDMSLVGPRPEELWVVEHYTDEQRKRLMFKPGLTGPMQINGRGDLNFEERLHLEFDYMQNYSIVKDFSICLRSLAVVINGKGAH
jgi:lipopolysaccharide/colanic/teichoic acid biosynthesis glycosyltransferase/glycosyltransferase involved in cell wall biosynthesis